MTDIKKQQELANELSSKLWEMANVLRGNMEAYEFKNYILGFIFYRFLSEKTEDFMIEELKNDDITYIEAWNSDEYREDVIADLLETLGYVIEPQYLFSHVIKMIETNDFTIEYMEKIIGSIQESTFGQDSQEDFIGLFEDMDLKSSKLGREPKQRGLLIAKILKTIDTIDFRLHETDVDVLGTAYTILIGNFASTAGKKGGEFYTPTNMSKLVARLATVGLTDVKSAFDCACGSGSLLLQVGDYVNVRKYYGQELTSSTFNLARMNMMLHNIRFQNFELINVDTLENDEKFRDLKFDVQVANPPYSAKWSAEPKFLEDERYSDYGKLAPKSKADFAFLQHMIYHMDKGDSRIAVLLPHGVLFRGAAEETIRKYIVKELNYLDAVIGLPANCFNGTNIPVCCLVLKKQRSGNSNNICFIDASKYYQSGKSMNYITEEDINRIVDAYIERKDIDKFCHIASMDEIKGNDYNLNIPRYIDTFEEEELIDISLKKVELANLIAKRENLSEEIEKYFKELGL
jgi:type I restriction enzyme M protein